MTQLSTKEMILQELRALPKGGLVASEIARNISKSEGTVRDWLKTLLDEGLIFKNLDGKKGAAIWTVHKEEKKKTVNKWNLGKKTAHLQEVLTTWTTTK